MSEEYGSDFITIEDEEGNKAELEVLDYMDYNGKTYGAFLPADMDENDPDYGMIILRVIESVDGDTFEDIESDDELNEVYERFMAILFDDEDEEAAN